MNRLLFLLLLLAGSSAIAGVEHDEFLRKQAAIAGQIEAIPLADAHVFLYSLDPSRHHKDNENTDQILHGAEILVSVEVKAEKDKALLLKSFTNAIRESDGSAATCFNPRHGLRIVIGPSKMDFVICYECLTVRAYGFNPNAFPVSASPNKAFNELLDRYHLHLAKQANYSFKATVKGRHDNPAPGAAP